MTSYYARALFEFETTESNEIGLRPGDVVTVLYSIDDNWLYGSLCGQEGSFPGSFVEPISLPTSSSSRQFAAAVRTFTAEMKEDLGFQRGDIIAVTGDVDENWMNGEVHGHSGIFPRTHVVELPPLSGDVTQPDIVTSSPSTRPNAIVRARMDLKAQLADELSFSTGDLITVTEVTDAEFAVGYVIPGKSGSFPLCFVDVVEGDLAIPDKDSHVPTANFNWWKNGSAQRKSPVPEETHLPVAHRNSPVYSPVPQSHMPQYQSEPPALPSAQPHPAAANSSERSDAPPAKPRESNNNFSTAPSDAMHLPIGSSNHYDSNVGVTAYGQTLFPFVSENENELTFFDNEIVTLIRHVNAEWMEGEIEGKRGIFPTAYVNIIVDCDAPDVTMSAAAEPAASGDSTDVTYGLIKYDFAAQHDGDLDVTQGDTVTVMRRLDEHWFEARHDDGRVGFVPVTYVDLFGDVSFSADVTVTSHDVMATTTDVPDCSPNDSTLHVSANSSPVVKPHVVKPKPQLKPKPVLAAKPKLSTVKPAPDPNLSFVTAAPSRQKRTISLDMSLDDVIQSELKAARAETTRFNGAHCDSPQSTRQSFARSQSVVSTESEHRTLSELQRVQTLNEAKPSLQSSPSVPAPGASQSDPVPARRSAPPQRPMSPPSRPAAARSPPPRPVNQPLPRYVNLGPKPVPRRAAPPTPGSPMTSSADLMAFSPTSDEERSVDPQVLNDLERRIRDTAQDLETCRQQRADLQALLQQCDVTEDRAGLEESVKFYTENIDGLDQELSQLHDELNGLDPKFAQKIKAEYDSKSQVEEQRRLVEQQRHLAAAQHAEQQERRREQRALVVTEIMHTERLHVTTLRRCMDLFLDPTTPKCPQLEVESLFGNMSEVVAVSESLLLALEKVTADDSPDTQIIGKTFIDIKDTMKDAYAPYCRNHDDAIALLSKLESDEAVQEYLRAQIDVLRQDLVVFDLGSILIKPVQRVLKYPLLLNELVKNTEEHHPDKPYLLAAISAMTELASEINEFKRRKDLVSKYKNDSVTIGDKVSRLNMHSTRKKFHRITQRIVGIQTIDENFVREERKFQNLEKAARVLVKNIGQYLENIKDAVGCQEVIANDIALYYGDSAHAPEVEEFCNVNSAIATELYGEFRLQIEGHVLTPLNRLLSMFLAPAKVIKKRHDKLLDYDNCASKVKGLREGDPTLKTLSGQLTAARADYEALNAQLLDELPRLYTLAVDVVNDTLLKLLHTQRTFYRDALSRLYHLLSLPLVLSQTPDQNILESFNIAHVTAVERLSDLSFVTKTFNPRLEDKKPQPRRSRDPEQNAPESQSDSQRAYLRQIYLPERLFSLTSRVVAAQHMDLGLASGTLVGVVKEGDPMGNKERWFIDTGASKGFVLRRYLTPASPSRPEQQVDLLGSPGDVTPAQGDPLQMDNLSQPLVNICLVPESASVTSSQPATPPPLWTRAESPAYPADTSHADSHDSQCRVLYDFTARSALELTVTSGDVITILRRTDDEGNPDWWMANKNGRHGYVPANYLTPYR